jgi:hypothetical protein
MCADADLLKLGAGERLECPPRNTDRFGNFVNFLFCTFCPIKEGFPKQLFEDFPRSPREVEDTHLGADRSKRVVLNYDQTYVVADVRGTPG